VSWTVIVPVKRLEAAKTRLRGALAEADHEALVLAMALDTVAAALASPVVGRVVVVTGDPEPGDAAAMLGAEVIADVPDAGLNPALAYAATLLRARGASASLPGVAALPADLPALRTAELTDALRQAEEAAGPARRGPARVRGRCHRHRHRTPGGAARRAARAVLRPGIGRRPRRQRRARADRGVAEPAPRCGHRGRSGGGLRARRRSAHGGGGRRAAPAGLVSAGVDTRPDRRLSG
jgi:hypothetical protein